MRYFPSFLTTFFSRARERNDRYLSVAVVRQEMDLVLQ